MDNIYPKELSAVKCRLCLSANGVTEPLGNEETDRILLQKVYECTSLQINPLPGAPVAFCTVCRIRLEDLYQFRWQCIRTDEIVQRIVAESNLYQPPPDVCNLPSSSNHTTTNTNGADVGGHYSTGDSKYYHPPHGGIAVAAETTFRRKRGRPPKQQYDQGSLSNSSCIQQLHTNGWSCERSMPTEFSKGTREQSVTSSDNHAGQDWYKIKLEQSDAQPQLAVENDEQAPLGDQQPVRRGRGRPPREGRCPNEDREEYRFCCQFCNARFKAAINLRLHTNTHTGERPYLCTICSKSFAHPSNLSVHMKLHNGVPLPGGDILVVSGLSPKQNSAPGPAEKRYQCPYCRSMFALAFQLKIHINTHTGQKPYVCKHCGKGFAQPSNLHVHEKKHCRRKQPTSLNVVDSPNGHLVGDRVSASVNVSTISSTVEMGDGILPYGMISSYHEYAAPSAAEEKEQGQQYSRMFAPHASLV